MATKKDEARDAPQPTDDAIQLLNAHIREVFVANARLIADNEKPERLLKMIQSCPQLKSPAPTNRELWKIVQRVREEVLGERKRRRKNGAPKKPKDNS